MSSYSIDSRLGIISYREKGATSSRFLNLDQVLDGTDFDKIFNIYENILNRIPAIEGSASSFKRMRDINERFKEKLLSLQKEPIGFFEWLFACFFNSKRLALIDDTYKLFNKYLTNTEETILPKEKKRSHPALIELSRSQLSNPQAELARLKKIDRVQESLSRTHINSLSTRQQIAIGHSIELRETFKSKYYVINHGQNLVLMAVNLLAKKLKQIFEPQQYRDFEIMRHDVFLRRIQNHQNIDWFKKTMVNQIDHGFRNELICGDAYLESTIKGESAISYFASMTNVALRDGSLNVFHLIDAMIEHYFPDRDTRTKLRTQILQLCSILDIKNEGTIYSICVPKVEFESVGYISKPYGHPISCGLHALDAMQNGCRYEGQIRLLTHKLDPNKGFMIVPHSTLSKKQIDRLEQDIEFLLQQAKLGIGDLDVPLYSKHYIKMLLEIKSMRVHPSEFQIQPNKNIQVSIAKMVQTRILPFYKCPMPAAILSKKRLQQLQSRQIPARACHGVMHATRVTLWTQVLTRFYEQLGREPLQNPLLLAAAGGMHDAARANEGIDYWDQESSEMLAALLQQGQVDQEIAERYIQTIREKDPEDGQFSTDEQRIVHDADCIDIIRVVGKRRFDPNHLCLSQFDSLQTEDRDQLIDEIADFIAITESVKICAILEHDSRDAYGDLVRLLFALKKGNEPRYPLIRKLIEKEMASITTHHTQASQDLFKCVLNELPVGYPQ